MFATESKLNVVLYPNVCNSCDESDCELTPCIEFGTLVFKCIRGTYQGDA